VTDTGDCIDFLKWHVFQLDQRPVLWMIKLAEVIEPITHEMCTHIGIDVIMQNLVQCWPGVFLLLLIHITELAITCAKVVW